MSNEKGYAFFEKERIVKKVRYYSEALVYKNFCVIYDINNSNDDLLAYESREDALEVLNEITEQ